MNFTDNKAFGELKNDFLNFPSDFRLSLFVNFPADCSADYIASVVKKCADEKIGLIIPGVAADDFQYLRPMNFIRIYGILLDCAEKYGIKVALNLEKNVEASVVRYFDDEEMNIRSRVILKREYYCVNKEKVEIPIGDEIISVVAVEERGELIDLRPFVDGGKLVWQVPLGNWRICRYFCAEDDEEDRVDILDYEKCYLYLDTVLELFRTSLARHIGKTLDTVYFSDICFSARNRRNWNEAYNSHFKALYGFDPAPYYPCLYDCSEESQKQYKSLLMACRAEMAASGIMKALSDTAKREGMRLLGSVTEPKISASAWILGDAMLLQAVAPCAKLEKSYMYGVNSIKIALGAALLCGSDTVACEAFGDYKKINEDIIYRETATAFARGANMMMAHLSPDFAGLGEYSLFVGRLQSVLRHGETVADVAMLYPIRTLQSRVSLYESAVPEGVFEYPETPDTTDYMSVINSIIAYSGRDVAVLHPDSFVQSLESGAYKVLVLPATEVISVKSMRTAAKFFDEGGKIIGTGVLPKRAAEPTLDGEDFGEEVRRLVHHIFGDGAVDENITGDFICNSNANGGKAYFLYSTSTGVDRCNFVPCKVIREALKSFGIAYDVYISDMPGLEYTSALNLNYPDYCSLGLPSEIRSGMMSYIHKKLGDIDIYYFSNATERDYDGYVSLKGSHSLEAWNVKSGDITPAVGVSEQINGEEYTKVGLKLGNGESVLLVSSGAMRGKQ